MVCLTHKTPFDVESSNFSTMPPRFSILSIDLEQIEWAECGVLTNVQICIVHSKVTILLLVVECPTFSSRNYNRFSVSPRGWKRQKEERPKTDVCIAITISAQSIFLLSVFNSVQILQLCFCRGGGFF